MTERPGRPAKIRILVLDEQPLFRCGMSTYLNSQPDMVVCGEADSIADTGSKIADCQPHVVVTELRLGTGDSLKLLKQLRAETERCESWCTPRLMKPFLPSASCARAQ